MFKFPVSDVFEQPPAEKPLIEQLQFLIDQCLPGGIGTKLVELSEEKCVATIATQQRNIGVHALMHGGALFTVGDTIAAMVCLAIEEPVSNMLTINASIRYLRPVPSGVVTAIATVRNREDDRVLFVCDFFNEEKKKVAQGKYLYLLIK